MCLEHCTYASTIEIITHRSRCPPSLSMISFRHRIAEHSVLRRLVLQEFQKLVVFENLRAAIDVQTDLIGEIHEQQCHVRILRDISQARHHAITAVLGIHDRPLVEHLDGSRMPGAEALVGLSLRV